MTNDPIFRLLLFLILALTNSSGHVVFAEEFETSTPPSHEAIPSRKAIESKRAEIRKIVGASKSEDKADHNKLVIAYDVMLKKMSALESESDPLQKAHLRQEIMELNFATRTEGGPRFIKSGLQVGKALLFERFSIPIRSYSTDEATNLSLNGKILNVSDLPNNGDLSRIDPSPDSMIWQRHDIRQVDMAKAATQSALNKGLTIDFPEQNTFELSEVKRSETVPKLVVFSRNSKNKKQSFTFKFGRETYGGPTNTALMSALGFSAYAMKHVENVKIYLGDMTVDEFKRDYMGYFRADSVDVNADLRKYAKDGTFYIGSDERGTFLHFNEGALIANETKGMLKVGEWGFNSNGHNSMREIRGLEVFNMWTANSDVSENHNNKVFLKKIDDDYQMILAQSDASYAFGFIIHENVGDYPWDLVKNLNAVKKGSASSVDMDLVTIWGNPLKGKMTYSDAKWMTRLIAQLSREQITQAVKLGHWPSGVDALLIEKLISRRNNLIEAFDLTNEFPLMPFDRKLTTQDKRVVQGELTNGKFAGVQQNFGDVYGQFEEILTTTLGNAIKTGVEMGVGSMSSLYTQDGAEIGTDKGLVYQVILNAHREIQLNPHPVNGDDTYLVQDVVKVGLRLGAGFILTGDGTKVYQYRLVWPAASLTDATQGYKHLINFSLPLDMIKNDLPPRYVLMREVFLEGAARLRTPGYAPITIGSDGKISRVTLTRSIVDNKNPDTIILHEDRSTYWDRSYRGLLEFFEMIRLPFVDNDKQWDGHLGNSMTYIIDRKEAENSPSLQDAISKVISHGKFDQISQLKKPVQTEASFEHSSSQFNLFGFYKRESVLNSDSEKMTDTNNKSVISDSVHHRSVQNSGWMFLDNSESSKVRISAYGPNKPVNELGSTDTSAIRMTYTLEDVDTWATELDEGYIPLANGLALDNSFIPFHAATSSRNGRFEGVNTSIDLEYCSDAVNRIMQLTSDQFWSNLADSLQLTMPQLNVTRTNILALRNDYLSRKMTPPKGHVNSHIQTDGLIQHAILFLWKLQKAKMANDNYGRLKFLTQAIRELQYRSQNTFSPILMGALNRSAENFFVHAKIGPPPAHESPFPGKLILENSRGNSCSISDESILLFPIDTVELYSMFQFNSDRR